MNNLYDVGLGRKYWYLLVKGIKKPVAKKLFYELTSNKEVEKWAEKEYKIWYMKRAYKKLFKVFAGVKLK